MLYDLAQTGVGLSTIEAPICIIGAGLAGLIAATKIAETGVPVVLLESGAARPDKQFDTLNEIEESVAVYRHSVTGRVRALGGTSTAWGGRMMPLTDHDLGAREYLGLEGWGLTKTDLDRHLAGIERVFGLDQTSYEADFATPFSVEALGSAGAHMQTRWAKWPTFRRRNIARNLRGRIQSDPKLSVWLNATVCGFDLDRDEGRISRVQARSPSGNVLTVSAEKLILACGTLESTRLLLWLDRLSDGRAFAGCSVLGRYFNDHLALQVGRVRLPYGHLTNRIFGYHIGGRTRRSLHLETTARAQRQDRSASGFVTIRPEFREGSLHHYLRNVGLSEQADGRTRPSMGRLARMAAAAPPALFWRCAYRQMYFGQHVELFVDARIEQVASYDSRLTLSAKVDQFGIPRLCLEWKKTETDEHTFRSVLRRARQFWGGTVLDKACPVDWDFDPDDDNLSLCQVARDTRHPAGSARMGVDRKRSVVDRGLRCHTIPNLLVASAAVFPSSGSANPTLTVMQLASIAAESAMAH